MKKLSILIVLLMSVTAFGWGRRSYTQPDFDDLDEMVKDGTNAKLVSPDANLQDAYDWLKSSNRDGKMGALSDTNWRTLILMPGKYVRTSPLVLDVNYTAITGLNKQNTIIQSNGSSGSVLHQEAGIIALKNLKIEELNNDGNAYALHIKTDNSGSYYCNVDFKRPDQNYICVLGDDYFYGTWWRCKVTNGAGFRVDTDGVFAPTMYFCEAYDPYSFGGDRGTYLSGYYYGCKAQEKAYGGCTWEGMKIDADAVFIDCEGGARCFATGKECAGSFYNCRVGEESFGWTYNDNNYGTFTGFAQDCKAGYSSFGAGAPDANGYNSGTMINCTVTDPDGNGDPMRLKGATIRNSRIECKDANDACVILHDSNSIIYNTDLIVNPDGTGIPIDGDGSARDVVAAHCRMNNEDNVTDGLGANVVNRGDHIVTSGLNVVDDDIK